MDQIDEVLQAENELLNALRSGELLTGVAMHLDSPDYRNIWSGELKTYDQLRSRIEAAIGAGLVSIDYRVSDREVYVLDGSNVITTLTATETTHMRDGQSTTDPTTIISILWRKINTKWRLAYLHASEKPADPSNPVWKDG
jgi:hypothetical protein